MLSRHSRKKNANTEDVKIVVVGDVCVGKTSLITNFCKRVFNPNPQNTLGCAFRRKHVEIEGRTLVFNIWDTAGQEKYRSTLPLYFRCASAAILTYDITEKTSFDSLQYWMAELKKYAPDDTLFAVAGNKCDLEDVREVSDNDKPSEDHLNRRMVTVNGINIEVMNGRQVSYEAGSRFAEHHNAIFLETSAKTGKNIQTLFDKIGQELIQKQAVQRKDPTREGVVQVHQQRRSSRLFRKLFPCFNRQATD